MAMRLEPLVDQLLPFGAIFSVDGRCLYVGRSLRKLSKREESADGFFDLFRVQSPRNLRQATDLGELEGKRLSLKLCRPCGDQPIQLNAQIAKVDGDTSLFILSASLGSDLLHLIDSMGLVDGDFSYADPSVDMFYLLKTQAALLADTQTLATHLEVAKDNAEALARTDPLTGLPNRRVLTKHIEDLLMYGDTDDSALLHIDLDDFKRVNDSMGHSAGDAVLLHVAQSLAAHIKSGDIAARIGGDEFIVVTGNNPDNNSILSLSRRLSALICEPVPHSGEFAKVGVSIGATRISPQSGKSVDDVLLEADLALYEAKKAGRGRACVFDQDLSERQAFIQQLTRDIEAGLANGQFQPHYQVQYDTSLGLISGAEVLARWHHPSLGILSPSQFMYVAERAKLIERIDEAICESALDHLSKWQSTGIAPPHLCFNVTADRILEPNFATRMSGMIKDRSLRQSSVMFELIESILIDGEADDVRAAAGRLSDAGFRLALDDFGTGRASIASLLAVPVSLVKIDRTFVSNVHKDARLRQLTRAIIQITEQMGFDVLAEGVESKEEVDLLTSLGCTVFQGFYFGRPVASTEFESLLISAKASGPLGGAKRSAI